MLQRVLLIALLAWALPSFAVIETYEFDDESMRARYQKFTQELRCPKCQNQNLADSNSPISEDLRKELYRLLQEGRSDQQIVDFMTRRYGDFILYRPPVNQHTALLWFGPLAMGGIGLIVLIWIAYRQRQRGAQKQVAELSDEEQQRLEQLLREQEKGE